MNPNSFVMDVQQLRGNYFMHSLMSQNQLAGWNSHTDGTASFNDQDAKIDDYFACLIECEDDESQSNCTVVCKEVLD